MNSQKKMVYVQRLFNPSQYRSNGLTTLTKENFARIMIESINKAINSNETPVKEKHVRKLLIGSYQAESGHFFWEHLPVIRLKENKIVCWKFCLVLHKMLRDGHRQVLTSFYDRRQILLDCGNMWRHVEDSYGRLIHGYCTLLYNRINFLKRNRFPNDLKLTDEELSTIGEDLNVFFDLCCEIFDMLEDILSLQELILSTVDIKKYNSTTSSGQLHLAPLVACIQDSSLLYDYSVKILFSLHGGLNPQILSGHRDRFLLQHKALKEFYINTSNLQYFKTLIQIPHLPDRPPNFFIASDLQQHVTPQVVMIHQPERDSPDQLSQMSDSQLLVNLTEDLQVGDSESTATHSLNPASTSNEDSIDAILNQTNSLEEYTSLSGLALQEKIDDATKEANELRIAVDNLQDALESEKTNHIKMKESLERELSESKNSYEDRVKGLQAELKKTKDELRDIKYKMASSKNDYEKLQDECERAKHDNEISQGAMKKLVKDLNDLKNENANLLQPHCPNPKLESQTSIQELEQRVRDLEAEVKRRDIQCQGLEREKEALLASKISLEKQLDIQKQDLLSTEMENTDKIIRAAAKRIEELSEKSSKLETGVKLEVNERILEVCTNLMNTLPNLIIQSSLLQREIVGASGKANTADFYKRNSSWTDGLISAANIVAMAATTLVNSAELTLAGQEKLSTLAAAAHEVDTAVQQLIYASQVKVESDSQKQRLQTLIQAARQVSQCVVMVVDTTRVCAALTKEEVGEKVDINSLNLYNTKRLEIETQGRLYELEDRLTKEREKLFLLRRRHYELEEPQENTEEINTTKVTET